MIIFFFPFLIFLKEETPEVSPEKAERPIGDATTTISTPKLETPMSFIQSTTKTMAFLDEMEREKGAAAVNSYIEQIFNGPIGEKEQKEVNEEKEKEGLVAVDEENLVKIYNRSSLTADVRVRWNIF